MSTDGFVAEDDIWMMTDNTLINPCTGDMDNKGFNVTTLCWNLAGSKEPNIEFIVQIVGRQYGVDVFLFQESFSAHWGKQNKYCRRNMAGYMAFICQCNEFHPARRLPSIFLSRKIGVYTEHVRSNDWCIAVPVRVSRAQRAIVASIHLPSDQNIMKYIAAVTSVTGMISELIMTSVIHNNKMTGEKNSH